MKHLCNGLSYCSKLLPFHGFISCYLSYLLSKTFVFIESSISLNRFKRLSEKEIRSYHKATVKIFFIICKLQVAEPVIVVKSRRVMWAGLPDNENSTIVLLDNLKE